MFALWRHAATHGLFGSDPVLPANVTAAVVTMISDPGLDTVVPSEKAVRTNLNTKPTAALVTSVGSPGVDTNVPSEKAIATALAAKPTAALVTSVGSPGVDTNVPSEKAVRTSIGAIPAPAGLLLSGADDPTVIGTDGNFYLQLTTGVLWVQTDGAWGASGWVLTAAGS